MSILKDRVDWLQVVETAYRPEGDIGGWADGLIESSSRLFAHGEFLGFLGIEYGPEYLEVRPRVVAGLRRTEAESDLQRTTALGSPAVHTMFFPPSLVATHAELENRMPPGGAQALAMTRREHGVADVLGVVLHPAPGFAAVLFVGAPAPIRLSRHERLRLGQIGLHLETGLRLRLQPGALKAVLEPNGKLVHLEKDAPPRQLLARTAKRVDAARTRRSRRQPESLDLWAALVAGRVSLVERYEGSRRYYAVVENRVERHPIRALTRAESDVVTEVARGLSGKLAAYGLGLRPSTVSSLLATAACKIGVANRTDLVRLAAMLMGDPRAKLSDAALSKAEREILDLVARGLTNQQIAEMRNRSVRTIANQVAALLRKTTLPSRRALATRV
jgi:DNA-binding CsgD family transcriptional regulator